MHTRRINDNVCPTLDARRAKLSSEIEASMQAYRACKRKVAEASAKFIAERSKNARKQAAVEKYVDLLSRSKLLGARAERNLQEVEAILKQHQTVRDTTQRRVEYEQGKLDEVCIAPIPSHRGHRELSGIRGFWDQPNAPRA